MKRVAIITTHPVQYNAPLFKRLSQNGKLIIKVFYTWGEGVLNNKFDPGFGKIINWDIPLLEGYEYTFVRNISKNPGSHHFYGIINPTLVTEIEDWKADAILVFGWSFKSHLRAMRYFHRRIPVYFRGDSTLLDEKKMGLKKVVRHVFLKWIYSFVDCAFYVGQTNKAYFKKCGLKEHQLKFAPHAIDNTLFEQYAISGHREQLQIPEDATVFLFAGKFEAKKNPGILMEAFSQLNDRKAYLILTGNGKLEENLKKTVNKFASSVQKRIIFLDFQNQSVMPAIYKTADVFVLPSSGPGETWGLSVNEAMAASLPVLVSDKCGCHIDLVRENVNGFTFKANDVTSLIFKMNCFLEQKHRLKKMGDASKMMNSDWSYLNICETIESTINVQ